MLVWALAAFAGAHPTNIPIARAKIGVDHRIALTMRFDILAFVLEATPTDAADGPMNALLDGPAPELQTRLDEAESRFKAQLSAGTIDSLHFPKAGEVKAIAARNVPRVPTMVTIRIAAHLAPSARTVSLQFPPTLGAVVLTTEFPYQEPISEPVEAGAPSMALTLPTAQRVTAEAASMRPAVSPFAGVVVRASASGYQASGLAAKANDGMSALADATGASAEVPAAVEPPKVLEIVRENQPAQQNLPWFSVFPSYVKMGFTHIVPQGLDHILFVLGLFLLSTRWPDLLKQITAFTIAHSLTLALALYGVVRLPSSVVEPIIALSIVFVAVENLFSRDMKPWRLYVVFLFGLVHGLGFAGALQDAGLRHGDFLTALVGFNAGVEVGQMSVVAAAFVLVGWFRSSERYRPLVVMPASLAIAAVALLWTVQRVFHS